MPTRGIVATDEEFLEAASPDDAHMGLDHGHWSPTLSSQTLDVKLLPTVDQELAQNRLPDSLHRVQNRSDHRDEWKLLLLDNQHRGHL